MMDDHLPPTCGSCGEAYWQFSLDGFVHLPGLCPAIGVVLKVSLNREGRLELHATGQRMFEEELQRIEQ